MGFLLLTQLLEVRGGWDTVNGFNHTSFVAFVTSSDRPKSVRNPCVIKVFGDVFVLSCCFLYYSVDVETIVIWQSQVSAFSLMQHCPYSDHKS